MYTPENYVIQQFTGFTDKNQKKIYEGDIVKYSVSEYGEIIFKFGGWRVRRRDDSSIDLFGMIYSNGYPQGYSDYTIIGNIFENPELCQ
jgi:uncharacterized phage protein (TIGR01671 family)